MSPDCFAFVSVGWNDTRLNMQMWRQQPGYVSAVTTHSASVTESTKNS